MNLRMTTGLGLAKNGLRAIKGGQIAFRWGGRLKQLPPFRKKAAAKAVVKALKKEEKQIRGSERKKRRQLWRKNFCWGAKMLSRTLSVIQKHYF